MFTNFGNAAYLVPLGALAFFQVRQRGGRRAGLVWILAFVLGLLAVAVSKILFYGWGLGVPSLNLTCFSGHTFLALTVWPLLSWLALQHAMPRLAWLPGMVLGLLVACSRVGVGAHSIAEVVAGGALAFAVLGAMQSAWRPAETRGGAQRLSLPLLCAPVVLGLIFASTAQQKLPTERYFSRIGVAMSGAGQPMSRERWLRQWEEGRRGQASGT